MKTNFHKILKSKHFKLGVGIFLIASSLHDLWGNFTDLHKEHLNLLIGLILIFDSLNDFIRGVDGVLETSESRVAKHSLLDIKKIINSRVYHIAIGLFIVVGSLYDISEDYEKIRKEHLELVIGIVFIIFSLLNMKEAEENFKDVIEDPKKKLSVK